MCSGAPAALRRARPRLQPRRDQRLPRPHPPLAINAIWALTDFTRENGATLAIPGSHRRPTIPKYGQAYGESDGVIAVTMKAGSILLFNSALWHGAGENRSNGRRYALSCYYGAGWLRQQENLQLGIPRGVAAQFPRRLQELCGYSIYKGQWGHIDNRDPITLLGRDDGRPTVWQETDARSAGSSPKPRRA